MSPIIPSRYGHPKYNIFPQKSRATSLGAFKSSQRGAPGTDSKSRRKQRLEENKITVQPTEDDDGDNFFSKHLAAARFQRNHRLINVLFSDIVVDQETISDNDKLQACKKRVKSLSDYQKKLDDEILELNEKFSAKKVKIVEDGKKFGEQLTKYITTAKKELEGHKAAQEIRRQQEAVLRQQAKADSTTNNLKSTSVTNSKDDNNAPATQSVSATSHQVPMKVNQSVDGHQDVYVTEIGQLLSSVLDSVANAI